LIYDTWLMKGGWMHESMSRALMDVLLREGTIAVW